MQNCARNALLAKRALCLELLMSKQYPNNISDIVSRTTSSKQFRGTPSEGFRSPGRFVRFARNNFAVILLFFRLFDAAPRGISDVMLVLVA